MNKSGWLAEVVVESFDLSNSKNRHGTGKIPDCHGKVYLSYDSGGKCFLCYNSIYLAVTQSWRSPEGERCQCLQIPRKGDKLICKLVPSGEYMKWKAVWWAYAEEVKNFKEFIKRNPSPEYRVLEERIIKNRWGQIDQKEPRIMWEGSDIVSLSKLYPIEYNREHGQMIITHDSLKSLRYTSGSSVNYRFEVCKNDDTWEETLDPRCMDETLTLMSKFRENKKLVLIS